MKSNYDFFMKTDVAAYAGEWIAICEQKIVSHGKDAKKVMQEAEDKCRSKRILLAYIPSSDVMIY